jgi:hypothetical protein
MIPADADIIRYTELFRNSSEPFWVRFRELVEKRGISVLRSVLAISFEDDVDFEFGVLVTADRRVFQFGFSFRGQPVRQGTFREWVDLTDRYTDSPYSKEVTQALLVVEAEGSAA